MRGFAGSGDMTRGCGAGPPDYSIPWYMTSEGRTAHLYALP